MTHEKVIDLAYWRRRPRDRPLSELVPPPMAAFLAACGIKSGWAWQRMRWREKLRLGLTEEQVLRVDCATLKTMPQIRATPAPRVVDSNNVISVDFRRENFQTS